MSPTLARPPYNPPMPTFGRAMLAHWRLDPADTYLNHGTVGATPRRVMARQQALRDEMEQHPARFVLREVGGYVPAPWRAESRLSEAMRPIAAFVGAQPADIVFVPNVTLAMNAVVQSFPFAPGDHALVLDVGYGAVNRATAVAATGAGATVTTVTTPHPLRESGAVVDAVLAALTPRTRLVVIDHLTANTALILPVAEVAAACRARGVAVAVDGAHVPGQMPLDIPSLGVDFYGANLHKWAYAPRPCGFLWVAPEHQARLHHPVVSWGRDLGFRAELEWGGTTDMTACLAAPEGVALLDEWGRDAVVGYMHGLAVDGGRWLAERWGTRLETPASMIGAMVSVPLPRSAGTTDAEAAALRLALLTEDRIEVAMHAVHGQVHARVSTQVYTEMADLERLGEAVARRVGRR